MSREPGTKERVVGVDPRAAALSERGRTASRALDSRRRPLREQQLEYTANGRDRLVAAAQRGSTARWRALDGEPEKSSTWLSLSVSIRNTRVPTRRSTATL